MVKYNRTHMCGELTIENIKPRCFHNRMGAKNKRFRGLLFID